MTRRLALVITSVVVATLLFAGLGTLVVGNFRARQVAQVELRRQASDIATNLETLLDTETTADRPAALRRRLNLLQVFGQALDLDGLAIYVLRDDGALATDDPPEGFNSDVLDTQRLALGKVVSGFKGKLAFAAAPTTLPNGRTLVVVVTREPNAGARAAADTFVLAALATLALGIAAAIILGRRLTKPIREASEVTTSIARGELSARLPEPGADEHDEFADLARSVNAMASELERSRVLEQQFLLSVSHDLRTPLTSIRGYAEAISDGAADPQRSAMVIRSEARRLERLVADLLDLAKLRSKSFSLRPEPVDLVALATVACDGFQPDAHERNVLIRPPSAADTHQFFVVADHDRLAQVAANLIENALKYARTEVSVTVTSDGSMASLIVDDDGSGIAGDDLAHVFDRLYVARSQPTRNENSSGLGLAIVKELVDAMGGSCRAGHAPIGGARLEVWLPMAR